MQPTEFLTLVAGLVEKGGVSGLLLVLGFFGWRHLQAKLKELGRVYRQRDFCRQVRARYKLALDQAGIAVNIKDIEDEMKEDDYVDKE